MYLLLETTEFFHFQFFLQQTIKSASRDYDCVIQGKSVPLHPLITINLNHHSLSLLARCHFFLTTVGGVPHVIMSTFGFMISSSLSNIANDSGHPWGKILDILVFYKIIQIATRTSSELTCSRTLPSRHTSHQPFFKEKSSDAFILIAYTCHTYPPFYTSVTFGI